MQWETPVRPPEPRSTDIPITMVHCKAVQWQRPTLTAPGTYPWPSPVTEFYDNGTTIFSSASTAVPRVVARPPPGTAAFLLLSQQLYINGRAILHERRHQWLLGHGRDRDRQRHQTTAGRSADYFVSLNGATAGGAGGATPASSNCSRYWTHDSGGPDVAKQPVMR